MVSGENTGAMAGFVMLAPADECDDPLFTIALMAARGNEEQARDAYGDRTVDSAISRVLAEEGW